MKLSERLEKAAEIMRVAGNGNKAGLFREAAQFVRAVEGAWQPIETAPKDGTSIDVWNGERIPDVSWCRPDGGSIDYKDWCASVAEVHGCAVGWCMENIHPQPTHWRPRPEAPALVPVGQEGRDA